MDRKIFAAAAFFGMTAIILGAFGAHGLKKILAPDQLAAFETGVRYQMYHALFLLFVGLNSQLGHKAKKAILALTITGTVFFSGSIYLLSTSSIAPFNFSILGPLTPVGGLLLIVSWGILAFHFIKKSA